MSTQPLTPTFLALDRIENRIPELITERTSELQWLRGEGRGSDTILRSAETLQSIDDTIVTLRDLQHGVDALGEGSATLADVLWLIVSTMNTAVHRREAAPKRAADELNSLAQYLVTRSRMADAS